MATTASGWPYVLPADHPKEYPASSQALANKLEADTTGMNVSPAAPWVNYFQSLKVTRNGSLVTLEGWLKHSSGFTAVAGTTYTMATLSAGYWPAASVDWPGMVSYPGSNATWQLCRMNVYTSGAVSWIAPTAGAVTANGGWVPISVTYRAA